MATTIITIVRDPDRLPGWWVSARVEWGEGAARGSAQGLMRSLPVRTRRAALAWAAEQFPNAMVVGRSKREVRVAGERRSLASPSAALRAPGASDSHTVRVGVILSRACARPPEALLGLQWARQRLA